MSESASSFPSPAQSRLSAWLVGGLTLLGLLLLWPYQHWDFAQRSSLVAGLIKKAMQNTEWAFCLTVPFIVGWLVWRMRAKLKKLPLAGSWLGVPVFLVGMSFFWFGYKADTAYPGYVAAQAITLGLILLLGGIAWARALFFPWLFLTFMWPMLPLENQLAVPLRVMTAKASTSFLNTVGIPVVREGTGIHSAPNLALGLDEGAEFSLDVDVPCSGIRSLFSLMMISALYGYIALRGVWPRLLLFASAIPLAVLGNFVRMILLGVGSKWFGPEFAVGRNLDGHQEMSFYHSMAGLAVFGVALAGMFAICTLLERRRAKKKGNKSQNSSAGPAAGGAMPTSDPRRTLIQVVCVVIMVAGGLAICAATDTGYNVGPSGVKGSLPAKLGGFESTELPMTSKERGGLAAGVQIGRRFYTSANRAILATVVLSGPEKRSLHQPEVCLPSQGWTISNTSILPVDLGEGRVAHASVLSMYRDAEPEPGKRVRTRALNIFWYLGSDGTVCATYDEHVARSYFDAVFKNLNHRWALMSFFVPMKEEAVNALDPFAEVAALEDARRFITELGPQLLPAL